MTASIASAHAHDGRAPQPHEAGGARRPAKPSRLEPGTVLDGRYRIDDVIGAGGMSTVYQARDLRFPGGERLCAIKEMVGVADDPKPRQARLMNFQREAALLARLAHPAIPKIYDYFEQDHVVYLVLELVRGQDLEALLERRGHPFDEKTVAGWGLEVARVLSFLHAQQPEPIIFRDIKPSNIMLRSHDRSLVLIDFGIARNMTPALKATMIGTEGYAPPEQYRGIVDVRGDIYALGATMHHLVTGNDPRVETPFTFDKRPPRKLNSAVSAEFEAIILKCVAYEQAERFQSADALVAALVSVAEPEMAIAPQRKPRGSSRLRDDGGSKDTGSRRLSGGLRGSKSLKQTKASSNLERISWSLQTGDEVRCSPSYSGGAVYVGSYDGKLYAIDETDGSVRWSYATGKGIVSRPAVSSELVIIGSEDRSVYAISRQSGRAVWSFRTGMPIRSSITIDGERAIFGGDDGTVYCLSRRDGAVLWRYTTWGPVRSTAVVLSDTVVIGSDDTFIHAISASKGTPRWRTGTGGPVIASGASLGQNIVIGSNDGYIRGISAGNGESAWSVETGKAVISTPAIADRTAYVAGANGKVYAIAVDTGSLWWTAELCKQMTSSVAIDGDLLYVAGIDRKLYCLDRQTGEQVWTFIAERPIVSRPLVTDDHIIFGTLDGKIIALYREP